jgi:CubicO group peptidase (beta-lactamase class C family)
VKVENGTGGWAFGLQVLDDEGQRRRQAIALRRDLGAVDPGPRSNRYLLNDSFPKLVWRNESAGRAIFGDAPMEVRWFGPDLDEVEQPDKPGRYTAVIEATTVDGLPYRRMLAFAKVPPNFLPRFGGLPLVEPPLLRLPPEGVRRSEPLNAAQEAELSRHLWAAAGEYFAEGEGAAVAAAALLELADPSAAAAAQDRPPQLAGGHVRNVEHQLRLRMKLDGRHPKPLPPPKTLDTPAPELRTGSEGEAGLKPGTVERLRAVCGEWVKDDPNGFVVLVARRGVVVMHEGFGGFEKDQHFRPASIGKTIAGLTFARAVDEGLFTLDQKVGDVLPDWRQPPTSDVTFRGLFNHMDGLRGHHTLDGLFNAYLDNGLFVQDGAFADPLKRRHYNGDDHNLAGMALELVTGQTIMRLLYEQMQKPFGEPVTQFDLGFGEAFTAQYLAEVGQMLLQDGKYGPHQFFKPGLVEQLTPKRVADYMPEAEDKQLEWGIGLEWMIDPPGPRERGVLGPNVFGHGAASASVWRIAPDHDLVVVIGRNEFKTWNGTNDWAAKFMTALAEGMRE